MRQAGGQTSGSFTVAVVAYKNISQFRDEQNRTLFENLVIGVVLGNSTISNLTNTVNITFSHKAGTKGNRTCSFWVPMENGRGQWNTSGCVTISGDNQTVCQCQHLTFFALLLQVPGTSSVLNQVALVALTYISLIGCGVSAVFSVLSITIYFVYKQARRDQTGTIHVCLSASLLLLYLLFLVNEKLASLGSGALCALAGGVMHYALLSSLNWMAIETLHLYLLVVRVFNSYFRRYVLKLCLFGWGSPLLVVTIVGSLNQYGRLEVKTAGNQTYGHFCWLKTEELRGVYLLNLAYLALLFLCSLAVLTAVAHRVWAMRCSQPSGGSGRHGCRDTCTVLGLSLLLGSSWGFTFMGYGPVALPGLICFSVVNSLQGFFIFLLFSLTILKARKELASEMVLCSSEHPATSQDRAGRV
nr:PREDICTED: adhesion G-protein coupled receptor G5-like [Lepisosteus oculatus]